MISDYFKLAFKNLRRRQLRSWLTMIGIFVSIAIIFILISLSMGLQSAITEHVRTLGADKLFIYPSLEAGAPGLNSPIKMNHMPVFMLPICYPIKIAISLSACNSCKQQLN